MGTSHIRVLVVRIVNKMCSIKKSQDTSHHIFLFRFPHRSISSSLTSTFHVLFLSWDTIWKAIIWHFEWKNGFKRFAALSQSFMNASGAFGCFSKSLQHLFSVPDVPQNIALVRLFPFNLHTHTRDKMRKIDFSSPGDNTLRRARERKKSLKTISPI